MRILLAEDDLLLGDGIRAGLRLEGDTVEWVTDGVAAENALVTDEFDLLVLDIGLPRRSGLDILRNLRHQGRLTPVLLLTARDKVADRVAGLDSGADDYLTKPFDLDELQARVRALTRRTTGRALPQLVHGELRLDPATHQRPCPGRRWNWRRANTHCCACCWRTAARCSRATNWSRASTAGAATSRATPSKSTSTTCGASSATS